MVKEIAHYELNEAAESGKIHNIAAKAGRLAMELAAEKSVLHKNLKNCRENT